MNDKKDLFTSKDIKVACPKKMLWNEMEIVGERRRFCDGCDKVLFDVTGYSKNEVRELQQKHGSICVAVGSALLATTLSFSSLAAGGDVVEPEQIYLVEEVVLDAPVEVGLPVMPKVILQECDGGTKKLNAVKRFFGFEGDMSCRDSDVEEADE